MSFTLELSAGGIKAIYCGTTPHPKPFLQVIRLHKIESMQINSERYKILLSDGLAYMQGVLSPKLNHFIFLKNVSNFTVVKLIEYEVHEIPAKGVKIMMISNMEDIVTLPNMIGSPVSIEKFMSSNGEDPSMRIEEMETAKVQEGLVNSLSTDFLHLFNNQQLSDITFVLKDKQKLFAHKNILCARSSYFQSLFLIGMKESFQNEMEVNAWDPEVFTAIIRFIYSDQVLFSPETQVDRVWSLYMAARYYQLERLLKLCEQFLIAERLSIDTVCLLWNTSIDLDAKDVEVASRKYFEQHFEEITEAETFVYINKDLLLSALKSEELIVSNQDKVAQAILKWGRAQMGMGVDITKQELFCTFFPLLRSIKRKWNPSQNIDEIKKAVAEAVTSAGPKGIRITQLNERTKISADDIKNGVQLLQQEGAIYTPDGEHWIVSGNKQKKGFFQALGFSK